MTIYLSFVIVIMGILVSCAQPTEMPTPSEGMIELGEKIGDMVIRIAPDESGTEHFIWDYCYGEIAEADPDVFVRDCTVPMLPYLFTGFGMGNETEDGLDSNWPTVNWELSIDGQVVDLPAFGTIDLDWGSKLLECRN